MQVKIITSGDKINIEQSFKVSAGPGAGKTYWLVNHMKQVLIDSKRLGSYRKIACITYTNTAVNTISNRLGSAGDRVEVSTIHSFMYNNIVKPYISFIADKYEFNSAYMDGHDDHYISRSNLKEWIDTHRNLSQLRHPYLRNQLLRLEGNLKALSNWISSIHYKFNGQDLEIAIDNSKAFDKESSTRLAKTACLDKLTPGIEDYKRIFWRQGILHHDDVLFFGYQLLKEHPFILTVLQAKFPYFFIDEFQDTSPIQTAVIKLLSIKETVIGVIGDKAQAIYSFQGTSSLDFERFSLPNQQHYAIEDNRRSTIQIVNVLNHIRKDLQQKPLSMENGELPMLLVGSREDAFTYAKAKCRSKTLITLSRDNIMVNAVKRLYNAAIPVNNLLDELFVKDNPKRVKVMYKCMKAVEFGRENRFKEAIKEMEKINSDIADKQIRRKTAFKQLSLLLTNYKLFKNAELIVFYDLVKSQIRTDITTLSKGAIKTFYEEHTFAEVALFLKDNEEVLDCRTIHKAKGDEFNNVFITGTKDVEVNYLLSPNLTVEEQRIRYVAFSRAKHNLFINIPELTVQEEEDLKSLFEIKRHL